jgi:hypothetical protein
LFAHILVCSLFFCLPTATPARLHTSKSRARISCTTAGARGAKRQTLCGDGGGGGSSSRPVARTSKRCCATYQETRRSSPFSMATQQPSDGWAASTVTAFPLSASGASVKVAMCLTCTSTTVRPPHLFCLLFFAPPTEFRRPARLTLTLTQRSSQELTLTLS